MKLKPFYWNFDGLDVTFQGRIPDALMEILDTAKTEAQNTRAPVLIEWQNEPMHVAESGARVGYAYRCDTGPVGATWFFSRNQSIKNWNIRVSIKSNALASLSLGGVRHEIYRFLDAIGAEVVRESISRIDYCMDFLADDIEAVTGEPFALNPTAFVMHSHTSRNDHDDDAGIQMNGVSGRYTSVTCGKMPGRQVILYDKSLEVRMKQKKEWWAHWNAARERQNLAPLAGQEGIWRVELRAGKKHLKDRWGILTWEDLDKKLGDLLLRAVSDIRYALPTKTNKERTRWKNHPVWNATKSTITSDLHEMTTGAIPDVVKTVRKDRLAETTSAMIKGLLATHAVATDSDLDADTLSATVSGMVRKHVLKETDRFQSALRRSTKKYHFLENK